MQIHMAISNFLITKSKDECKLKLSDAYFGIKIQMHVWDQTIETAR